MYFPLNLLFDFSSLSFSFSFSREGLGEFVVVTLKFGHCPTLIHDFKK